MSLQMGYSDQVNDLLNDGYVEDIVETRRTIHTRAMQAAIGSRRANGVLLQVASEVNPLESDLPRGQDYSCPVTVGMLLCPQLLLALD